MLLTSPLKVSINADLGTQVIRMAQADVSVTPSDSIVSVGISTDAGLLQMGKNDPQTACCKGVMQSDSWISTDAGLLQMSLWNMLLTSRQQRCLPR
ncbi:hypothetical protein NQZ68_017803 [Dissostichus eleginoides]|nr:hypothetical protein NQZ68_017803 [Dissostichus eleginoides]